MKELATIINEDLQVEISPVVGASIYSMKYKLDGDWVDIMRPTPEEALSNEDVGDFASFNLFPYSNRIENALLKFKGEEYQLEVNFDDGHAIHGEAWTRPWQVTEADDERVVLEFKSSDFEDISWPFPFSATIEYRLEGKSFIVRTSMKNEGDKLMPAGMGIHPYFMRSISSEKGEKVNLDMDTIGLYPGETQIPTGHWVEPPEKWDFTGERELSREFLDNCFRAGTGTINVSWPESDLEMVIERDDIFKHVVIYCPTGEEFFALEPVTNCNNGFNMAEEGIEDTGIIELQPGEEVSGDIKFTIN
ncbi:MAG: aldose 1-epimerase [Halanaerobiales bacterium]